MVYCGLFDFKYFIGDSFTSTPWWRHPLETFSALLAICAENSPVPGEFPAQRPVTRSFDVFLDLRLNKRLSKQSWGWWFEMLSCSLWHHCNVGQWYDGFTTCTSHFCMIVIISVIRRKLDLYFSVSGLNLWKMIDIKLSKIILISYASYL